MGVQGLTSLVGSQPNIFHDVKLSNTRLVVDGHNLMYLMYFNSGLDQNRGGDYAAFEALIERFVSALRRCRVEPFMLLDGGSDPSEKKEETLCKRAEDLLQKAQKASQTDTSQNILPMMTKLVFRQTLARLKVPLAQCYAEADQEIAALAKDWNIPVLSADGDFYVFDLPAGFLPLSHFQWEEAARGSLSFIPCKMYNISSFCTVFGIQRHLVSTFAALAGNDYVKVSSMELSNAWALHAPSNGPPSARRLRGVLNWLKLRRFQTPSEVFEEALRVMWSLSREEKEKARRGWLLGMEEYKVRTSLLKNYFSSDMAPPFPNMEKSAALPDWMRRPLTQARLTADVLDVLQLCRMDLSILVEDGGRPSAHQTSRPIRQVTYGLLLGRNVTVTESDRIGNELRSIPVQSTKNGAAEQLTLLSLPQAATSQRLQVLTETLRLDSVTCAAVIRLEPQLRLPMAVTWYWYKWAQPQPNQQILKMLLLLLSLEDGLEPRRALQRRLPSCSGRPDVGVVHSLNQWQSCLKHTITLNQLLDRPLPEPHVAWLYEGTLVHQMFRAELTHQLSLLMGSGFRVDVYHRLRAII